MTLLLLVASTLAGTMKPGAYGISVGNRSVVTIGSEGCEVDPLRMPVVVPSSQTVDALTQEAAVSAGWTAGWGGYDRRYRIWTRVQQN